MHLDLTVVLIVCVTWTVTSAKRGVVITAPDTWLLGSEEKVCASFHEINFDITVEAKVTLSADEDDSSTNAESHTFNEGRSGCFSMALSGSSASRRSKMYIRAWGTAADGGSYTFNQTKSINIQDATTKANVTFIETDKAIYKPGDKVQMRILTVREDLRPRKEKIPLVIVQNPSGIRIMQWHNIDVAEQQGLASLSFDLLPDPSLGTWKITVMREDGNRHSQTFTVEKYVLPKFEVEIKPQPFIPVWAESVHAQICAKYTYGQPVKGNLTVVSCLRGYYNVPIPCVTKTVEMEGCYNYSYPLKDVMDNLRSAYMNMYITINATVVEEGTGSVTSKVVDTSKLAFKKYQLEFVDMAQYFRPGMNFTGKVHITDNTGGSVEGLVVTVTVGNTAQEVEPYKLLTDSSGEVNFTLSGLELAKNSDYFLVRAHLHTKEDFGKFTQAVREPQLMRTVSIWYSPTKSAIKINKLPDIVDCRGNISVQVSLSGNQFRGNSFFHQLIVQSSIVQHGVIRKEDMLSKNNNHMTFVLRLPPSAWGEASLIIYIISGEEEVVADMKTFKIKQCISNNVTMQFNQPTYAPGDEVVLSLTAGPGSLCAYGVTDKSVLLLAGSNKVTMDSITDRIPRKSPVRLFDNTDEYCEKQGKMQEEEEKEDERPPRMNRRRKKNRRRPRMIMIFPSGRWTSRFVDSSRAFQMSHLVVMSDLIVDTRPCKKRPFVPYLAFDLAPPPSFDDMALGEPVPLMPSISVTNVEFNDAEADSLVVDTVRSYFPETWLWDIIPIDSQGRAEKLHTAPDTITEWVGDAVCTSDKHGLGISNTATMQTFQPFFLSVKLPYSAIRGETLLLPVSVFNYLSECLVISLELSESEHYRVDGANKYEMCVCQQKVTHYFSLTAQTLGHINITVTGESVKNAIVCGNVIVSSMVGVRDTLIREMLVEPEGKQEEYAYSSLMCPTADGGIEEYQKWTVPSDIVSDSLKAHATVIGDVMGPALSGLESLLKLPTGCGEQNMIKFAPNIYILQYLTNAHELNKQMEEKALGYMRTGYQRELQYRHSDGSYSAFGPSDESGSTWLTAFVLKSFSQAAQYIDIDEADLRVTRDWFEKNQLENGCFRNTGRVIHKSMKGGLSNQQHSMAPLTAYSLVALLEAGYDPKSQFILDAISCLSAQEYTDVYSAALVSYAYSLLGTDSSLAQIAMEKLQQFKREQGGKVFWAAVTSNITEQHHVVRAIDIEITAYALLAHLHMSDNPLNDLQTTLPIVRWLTAQRNPDGGFLSTQDTVVALQALAEFASFVKSEQGDVDISVRVNKETHSFNVNAKNHLLLQKEPVLAAMEPEKEVDILMKANGTGCCFVQASMKYNVMNVTRGSTHNIHMAVTVSRTDDNICYRRILTICIRYEGPDDATNMALLDVKMVTGWSPIEYSVEKLLQDSTLQISRFEVQKKNVNIYFTELARGEDVCLSFEVNEDIEVRNAKPGSVTIYDYYDQQEVFYQKEYTLRSICGTKEELPFDLLEVEGADDHVGQVRLPAGHFPDLTSALAEENHCPACYQNGVDTDVLKNILCAASHVYRGIVKNPGVLKVNKELVQKKKVNRLTSVVQPAQCSCPILDSRKQWVWIISPGTEIEEINQRQATIELRPTDSLVAVEQKSKALERLLKKLKRSKQCLDDNMP